MQCMASAYTVVPMQCSCSAHAVLMHVHMQCLVGLAVARRGARRLGAQQVGQQDGAAAKDGKPGAE